MAPVLEKHRKQVQDIRDLLATGISAAGMGSTATPPMHVPTRKALAPNGANEPRSASDSDSTAADDAELMSIVVRGWSGW